MAEAAVLGTLSAPLVWGNVYTELSITSTTADVAIGDVLQLGYGDTAQFVVLTDADLATAVELDFKPFVPNRNYEIGEPVLLSFGGGVLSAQYPNADIPGTLKVSGASDLVGNLHEEGTLTVDGASTLTGAVTASGAMSVAGALSVNGALKLKKVAKTDADTPYAVAATDDVIFCQALAADFVINLPTAASSTGRVLIFRRTEAAAHNVAITPAGAELLDGVNAAHNIATAVAYQVVSDGTSWWTF